MIQDSDDRRQALFTTVLYILKEQTNEKWFSRKNRVCFDGRKDIFNTAS